MPAFLIWGFWLSHLALGPRLVRRARGWTKFAALIVAPLWATYPEFAARAGGRRCPSPAASRWRRSRASGCCCSSRTPSTPRASSGTGRSRTQVDRHSPFSLWDWGQYHAGLPDLAWLQKVLEALLVVGGGGRLPFLPRQEVAAPARRADRCAADRLRARPHPLVLPLPAVVLRASPRTRCSRASTCPPRRRSPSQAMSTETRELVPEPAEPRRRDGRRRGDRDRRSSSRRGSCCTRGFYQHSQIIDTPIYQRYGDAIANGPGALPRLRSRVPARRRCPRSRSRPCSARRTATWRGYRRRVRGGDARLRGTRAAVHALDPAPAGGGPGAASALALGFAALAPLLLGSVVLSRFDLWPAALIVGALAALVAGTATDSAPACSGSPSPRRSIPAVLAARSLAVWVWKRRGRREALICARDLRGRRARAASCRSSCSRRTGCGTASPADEPAAADRDARRRRPARRARRSPGSGSRWGRATARRTWPAGGPDALAAIQTRAPDCSR